MKNWTRDLKVGDEFFDQTRSFLGIVTATTKDTFSWKWTKYKSGVKFSEHTELYSEYDNWRRLSHAGWIKATPLIKALL